MTVARETKHLGGHVTLSLATPPFRKILRRHVRTVSGNMPVKFEVRIALTVLELLAFNAQKFRGHVTVATPFQGLLKSIFFGMLRGSYVPNLVKIGPKLGSQFYP